MVPTTVHELPMQKETMPQISSGGRVEVVRVEELQSVIHHGDQRAAHRPRPDQRADREQDEDRAHPGAHALDRRLAHRLECVAAALGR